MRVKTDLQLLLPLLQSGLHLCQLGLPCPQSLIQRCPLGMCLLLLSSKRALSLPELVLRLQKQRR